MKYNLKILFKHSCHVIIHYELNLQEVTELLGAKEILISQKLEVTKQLEDIESTIKKVSERGGNLYTVSE